MACRGKLGPTQPVKRLNHDGFSHMTIWTVGLSPLARCGGRLQHTETGDQLVGGVGDSTPSSFPTAESCIATAGHYATPHTVRGAHHTRGVSHHSRGAHGEHWHCPTLLLRLSWRTSHQHQPSMLPLRLSWVHCTCASGYDDRRSVSDDRQRPATKHGARPHKEIFGQVASVR